MAELESIIAPAIVSAIVTTIIGPLIFFFLKKNEEKEKRDFEVKYQEYKKYLSTLEDVVSSSRHDFEKEYMKTISGGIEDILSSDTENSNAALIKLNSELDSLTSKVNNSFTKATSELHGLKLVCSDKLLALVDEFVKLQRELMDDSIKIMSKIDLTQPTPSFEVDGEMKVKAKRHEELLGQIIKQMRIELGVNGS